MMAEFEINKNLPTVGKLGSLGIFLLGVAAIGAAITFTLKVSRPPAPVASPTQEHNFELVQLGDFRRDQFLFDRKTGRIWQSICSGDTSGPDCNGLLIWKEMFVAGVTPVDSDATNEYLTHNARAE